MLPLNFALFYFFLHRLGGKQSHGSFEDNPGIDTPVMCGITRVHEPVNLRKVVVPITQPFPKETWSLSTHNLRKSIVKKRKSKNIKKITGK
jgi:hypothetical protein